MAITPAHKRSILMRAILALMVFSSSLCLAADSGKLTQKKQILTEAAVLCHKAAVLWCETDEAYKTASQEVQSACVDVGTTDCQAGFYGKLIRIK